MRNSNRSIVIVLSLVCSTAFAQTDILGALKSKSITENKNILIYFSGSDWCGPCIKFKNKFIETDVFKSYAENHLLVYNADFPRKKANQLSKEEISQNEKIADMYNPHGNFPFIVLVNSTGNILKQWDGLLNVSVEEFIKELK